MEKWKQLCGKIGKDRFLIFIIGGLLLLVITYPLPSAAETEREETNGKESGAGSVTDTQATIAEDTTSSMETRLAKILSAMDGAGKVKVLISYADSGQAIVEKDWTEDGQETVYTSDENGNKVPFVLKTETPGITGVLIVTEGGGNQKVASEMKEAIMALFGIDEHKIKVVKMKGEEG